MKKRIVEKVKKGEKAFAYFKFEKELPSYVRGKGFDY